MSYYDVGREIADAEQKERNRISKLIKKWSEITLIYNKNCVACKLNALSIKQKGQELIKKIKDMTNEN